MSLFRSSRVERRSWIGEPPVPPYPGAPTAMGVSLTARMDAALVVPAVWQCVSLIANAVALMPLEGYRNTTGVPQKLPSQPQLLTSPAPKVTQSSWLHQVMVSSLLRGNAIGQYLGMSKVTGLPSGIQLLDPDKVSATENPDGTITWRIGGKEADPDSIWYMPGLTLPGRKLGLSPIAFAAATLGVDIAARKFGGDYFSGGGLPKAVLSYESQINQEQARTIKDRWVAGTLSREPAVIGGGGKVEFMNIAPEEAQFLQTQQVSVTQIARFFGVPAKMIGGADPTSMTYANVEQLTLDFLTFTIAPWLKRIEDALSPLLPKPQFVKFDESALLRADAETSAKVDVQLIAGKILAPSEVRNQRGLPPMTEAQKTEVNLVPLTVTPLGGPKALPNPKAPGPNAPVPADDQQDEGTEDAA